MMAPKRVRVRGWLVFVVLILSLATVAGRLFYLQVLQYDRYATIAEQQSRGTLLTLPVRGKIFDRNMHPLAESIDTKSVVMMTAQFDPESQPLRHVSNVLDINLSIFDPDDWQQSRLTYLKRKLSPEELMRTRAGPDSAAETCQTRAFSFGG